MRRNSPGTEATGNMLTGNDSWFPIDGRTGTLGKCFFRLSATTWRTTFSKMIYTFGEYWFVRVAEWGDVIEVLEEQALSGSVFFSGCLPQPKEHLFERCSWDVCVLEMR